jgi:hypothetical protein
MYLKSFLFLVGVTISTLSSAAIISYDYSAQWIGDADTTIVGEFSYDSDDFARWFSQPYSNGNQIEGAGNWTGTVTGGLMDGETFNFSNLDIKVNVYDKTSEIFQLFFKTPRDASYLMLNSCYWTGAPINSLTIDPTDDFNLIHLGAADFGYPDDEQYYLISSYTPSAVPLPPAIWLFGTAMLGFIGWSRKKKS